MKKIIITIILTLLMLTAFSQTLNTVYNSYKIVAIDSTNSTPRYLVGVSDLTQDTLGIVITLDQAQKIDNDYELLSLYKSMRTNCDSTVGGLVQVVSNYKSAILLAQAKIKEDSVASDNQNLQILNLKSQIDINKGLIAIRDSLIVDKDSIITDCNLQLKLIKKQKNRVIEISSGISVFLFWMWIGRPGIK